MKTIKQLADLIEVNPDCQFVIDNDSWDIVDPKNIEDDDKYVLASSREYVDECEWYGPHYGGGLAAALVEILNRKGFKITAGAC